MTRIIRYHELMFDPNVPGYFRPLTRQEIQEQRLPKPEPVDAFRDKPKQKLRQISTLPDQDGYLKLAIDAVWYFFFGDKDDDNMFVEGELYRHRYVDTFDDGHNIHYEVGKWLFESECWCRFLETEPLHVCYNEFIRPLRNFITELFNEIETKKEKAV